MATVPYCGGLRQNALDYKFTGLSIQRVFRVGLRHAVDFVSARFHNCVTREPKGPRALTVSHRLINAGSKVATVQRIIEAYSALNDCLYETAATLD